MSVECLQYQSYTGSGPSRRSSTGCIADEFVAADTPRSIFEWEAHSAPLAIWRREPLPRIMQAIDRLAPDVIKGWRLTTDVAKHERDIDSAMTSCGLEHEELREYFASDITELVKMFVAGTGHCNLELRFDLVKNDSCRKFHTDNYSERLSVTYTGPGTVAVPVGYAEEALLEQETYSGPVFEVPRFWAALFAGKREDRPGLVHRSPRIVGTGQTRLFFCANGVMK